MTGSSSKEVEDNNCMDTDAATDAHDNSTVINGDTDQQQDNDGRTRDGVLRRRTRTHAAWTEIARREMILQLAYRVKVLKAIL